MKNPFPKLFVDTTNTSDVDEFGVLHVPAGKKSTFMKVQKREREREREREERERKGEREERVFIETSFIFLLSGHTTVRKPSLRELIF